MIINEKEKNFSSIGYISDDLYKGARTKVKVETHLSEELEADVGVHKGSVLSPLLFAIVVDVGTNEIKEGMLQEILYADDIVLIA